MWCVSSGHLYRIACFHQRLALSSESFITFIRRIDAERGMMRVIYSGTGYNHRHRVARFHQSVVRHSESITSDSGVKSGMVRVMDSGTESNHRHRASKLHQSVAWHSES